MFDDVIKLCCRQSDLLRTPEFWQAASFEQRMSEIREAVKDSDGLLSHQEHAAHQGGCVQDKR